MNINRKTLKNQTTGSGFRTIMSDLVTYTCMSNDV